MWSREGVTPPSVTWVGSGISIWCAPNRKALFLQSSWYVGYTIQSSHTICCNHRPITTAQQVTLVTDCLTWLIYAAYYRLLCLLRTRPQASAVNVEPPPTLPARVTTGLADKLAADRASRGCQVSPSPVALRNAERTRRRVPRANICHFCQYRCLESSDSVMGIIEGRATPVLTPTSREGCAPLMVGRQLRCVGRRSVQYAAPTYRSSMRSSRGFSSMMSVS